MADSPELQYKVCPYCGVTRPVEDFQRRTGRKAGKHARRGPCRACRIERRTKPAHAGEAAMLPLVAELETAPALSPPKRTKRRKNKRGKRRGKEGMPQPQPRTGPAATPSAIAEESPPNMETASTKPDSPVWVRPPLPALPPKPDGPDISLLRPNRHGTVGMRGKTDKGRRWYQETDIETAVTLVKEHAAVVVNRHTIRRIYSNKSFRKYVLARDRYTCYFCGGPGDTIDHLLPRAKGGHTTPANCVCACNLCNQSKADQDLHVFIERSRQ